MVLPQKELEIKVKHCEVKSIALTGWLRYNSYKTKIHQIVNSNNFIEHLRNNYYISNKIL